MSRIIPYAFASLLAVAAWVSFLVYMDAFTPNDVRAWRRLAALRGYATPRSRLEKLANRVGFIKRIQTELDLTRLLAIAGRPESPLGFLGRTIVASGGASLALLAMDAYYRAVQGDWLMGFPPIIFVFVWGASIFVIIGDLRGKVKKRQETAGKSLGDMLMLVAIMTDGRGLQLEDAVRILSRCVATDDLEAIVDRRGWQRLIHKPYRNTIELYRLIGEEYRIPAFLQLADAAGNANVGFSERETYTRLAKAVYQQRLAEAKMKGARAKILVTLPVAGMLIPLLVLLGAPTMSSIMQGLAAH